MPSTCFACRLLADSLHLYEESLARNIPSWEPRDFFLGSPADIQSRSTATGCPSCQSILLSTDHSPSSILTAHFSAEQPRVSIVAGEPDDKGTAETLASRREVSNTGSVSEEVNISYFLTTRSVTPQEPCARIVSPSHVDTKLIKSWIAHCDVSHKHICHRLYDTYLLPKAPLSFIDVHDLCIVSPPPVGKDDPPHRYIALSYVWGTAQVQLALKENVAELHKPGAFGEGGAFTLPRTVRNAIEVTAELGVPYLWVDSVCIVQDDAETQKEQLQGMGAVYANAYLTLVAASGEDANAGIPRVGLSPVPEDEQEPIQRVITLPDNPLIRTQGRESLNRKALNSSSLKWNTRGWTLQEKVFSRRLLGLGHMATWTCFGDEWAEDISLPSERSQDPAPASRNDKNKKMGIVTWHSIGEYSSLATEYARRDLTWSTDAINAFLGVMTPMAAWFPGGLLHGIAEYTFDIGMLWDVGPAGTHLRRDPGSVRPLHATNFKHPSWSWVSWQGDLSFDMWKAAEDYSFPRGPLIVHPLATWHKQLLTGEWVKIDNTYHVVRKHFEREGTSIPEDWTRHTEDQDGKTYYQNKSHEHIVPHPAFNYPIPPHVRYRDIDQRPFHPHIRFQGMLAHLLVDVTEEDQEFLRSKLYESDATLETDLISPDGFWCGHITLPFEKGEHVPSTHEVEVIAMSEGVMDLKAPSRIPHMFHNIRERPEFEDSDVYEVVNVLYIGRCVNGMVYRRALGGIWKQAWDELVTEDVELLLT
ncbi:unnamed protein product [Clonostachys byssicola]|uniref:Heterokaryon incompatibility domain-containing protein n=1 Tax=Clonostachys byssicola TaxID=160290 RepID=A0A9N9XV70_9HYPO|nr:unnamed protein product [Clonostachys byssicola]